MIGIHAGRIVATMANVQAFRYGSISHFIAESVSAYLRLRQQATNKTTITVMVFGSCPKPTSISFLDVAPKVFFERDSFGWHMFAPIKKPLAGGIGAVVSSKRTPRQRAKTAYNICARFPNYALAR